MLKRWETPVVWHRVEITASLGLLAVAIANAGSCPGRTADIDMDINGGIDAGIARPPAEEVVSANLRDAVDIAENSRPYQRSRGQEQRS